MADLGVKIRRREFLHGIFSIAAGTFVRVRYRLPKFCPILESALVQLRRTAMTRLPCQKNSISMLQPLGETR